MAVTSAWAAAEMRGARLDDLRRLPNLVRICEKLSQNAGKSLSAALGEATRQAAYDLFSRAGLTPTDLIAGHVLETAQRCQRAGEVIVAQDTVRFDYFTHRGCLGLGPIGNSPDSYGLFGHAALALRRDGLPLGILALKLWARHPDDYGKRRSRSVRSPEEKESRIWAETAQAVQEALPEEVRLILVQDREADVYAFLAAPRRPNTDLVVRAYHPRRVQLLRDASGSADEAHDPESVSLLSAWEAAPVRVAEHGVTVSARPATPKIPKRPEREATVEVRSARVRVLRSGALRARECPQRSVEMWAVWVREPAPPEGETGLIWVLLTTLDAGTPEGALEVLRIYTLRWHIEGLHRVLKSGLRVERLQIDDVSSLTNALAVCFVVAWRLLHLTYQARAAPESPATQWLSPSEQEVLAAKFGSAPATLREALRRVAQFGGWPGARRDREPGTQVLWQGLRDLRTAVEVWELAKRVFQGSSPRYDTS